MNLDNSANQANVRYMPEEYFELKSRIHDRLLDLIDLSVIDKLDDETLKSQIRRVVEIILKEESSNLPLNMTEREKIFTEILDEVLGYGPLEPLLKDATISDILVNTYKNIYIERFGKLEPTDARFRDNQHLMNIIDRIVSNVGRRIDESTPMVDARLPDGSRVNVIIPPLALDGPILSIRRFAVNPLELDDLIEYRTLTPEIAEILKGIIKARLNVIISGGTGSGKTTLLNVLSRFIPGDERIITIEDAAEVQLKQDHVVSLETRPPNIEGKGEVVQRDLLRNSLRMRPDRIIVGEVRGPEALDMLQAMNTGHDGSMTTIHANSPRDAMTRLEHMVGMSGVPIPALVIRQQIAAALNLLVDQERLLDGRRVITSIQEITGMEGDVVELQEIFTYEKRTVDQHGKVIGHFRPTGIRPKIAKHIEEYGIDLAVDMFDPNKVYE